MKGWQEQRRCVLLEASTDRGECCCSMPLSLLTLVQIAAPRQSMSVSIGPNDCTLWIRGCGGAGANLTTLAGTGWLA